MKKLKISPFYFVALIILIVACSDVSLNGDVGIEKEESLDNDRTSVPTLDKLPSCGNREEGQIVFVIKEQRDYKCENKRWIVQDVSSLRECNVDNEGTIWHSEEKNANYICKNGSWEKLTNQSSSSKENVDFNQSSSSKNNSSEVKQSSCSAEDDVASSSNVIIKSSSSEAKSSATTESSSTVTKSSSSNSKYSSSVVLSSANPIEESSSSEEIKCKNGEFYETANALYVCEDGSFIYIPISTESSSSTVESSADSPKESSSSTAVVDIPVEKIDDEFVVVRQLAGPKSDYGMFGYIVPLVISKGSLQKLNIAFSYPFSNSGEDPRLGIPLSWKHYGVILGQLDALGQNYVIGSGLFSKETANTVLSEDGYINVVHTEGHVLTFTFDKEGTWLNSYKAGDTVNVVVNFYYPDELCKTCAETGYDYASVPDKVDMFYTAESWSRDFTYEYALEKMSMKPGPCRVYRYASFTPSYNNAEAIIAQGSVLVQGVASVYVGPEMTSRYDSIYVKKLFGDFLVCDYVKSDYCRERGTAKDTAYWVHIGIPAQFNLPYGKAIYVNQWVYAGEIPTALGSCRPSNPRISRGDSVKWTYVRGYEIENEDLLYLNWDIDGVSGSRNSLSPSITYNEMGTFGASITINGKGPIQCSNLTVGPASYSCSCSPVSSFADISSSQQAKWKVSCKSPVPITSITWPSGMIPDKNDMTVAYKTITSMTSVSAGSPTVRNEDGGSGSVSGCGTVYGIDSSKIDMTITSDNHSPGSIVLEEGIHQIYYGCPSKRFLGINNQSQAPSEPATVTWISDVKSGEETIEYWLELSNSTLGIQYGSSLTVKIKGGPLLFSCH